MWESDEWEYAWEMYGRCIWMDHQPDLENLYATEECEYLATFVTDDV